MATITIDLPDQQAAALQARATAQGTTPARFAQEVLERALTEANGPDAPPDDRQGRVKAAILRIRALQKHVKPDPEGWTVRDYIDRGRP